MEIFRRRRLEKYGGGGGYLSEDQIYFFLQVGMNE